MIFRKRLLALLLAALMIISIVPIYLIGCDDGQNGDNTADTAGGSDTPDDSADTPDSGDTLDIVVDGESNVRVIRHVDLDTDDISVQAAMNIRKNITTVTNVTVPINDDWKKPADEYPKDTLEILVGLTDYPETAEAASEMKYGDYLVTVKGNKIVILGYTSTALNSAVNTFNRLVKNSAVKDEATGKVTVKLKKSDIEASGSKSKTLSAMPIMENAKLTSCYEPGNGNELIFSGTTEEIYNAYLAKLGQEGFKCHTTNKITDNSFATYYNENYTVNIGYYAYEKTIRMIVEPFTKQSLVPLADENKYDVVTTSQITMIGLEYVKNSTATATEYSSNGMSILIRLTDGRFIVVDGGYNRTAHANLLVQQMKEQSADYVAKTGGIRVAAWLITHAHSDHSGMIGGKYSEISKAKITVERFIVNFMSDTERQKAINYYMNKGADNWSATEGSAWSNVVAAADSLGADLCTAHVGHVYYFANAKLEVLYTIESYAPALTNAFNTTSVIIKMTFKDEKTGAETVYMHTGDATGAALSICNRMYGTYLKSDIVQVAHHGYTTWGNDSGTSNAYMKMKPATLLWPQGIKAYPKYREKSYNKVLWNESNPNYKETYIAGWEGSITTLPLPYTVGVGVVQNLTNPPA
ncbi:MAG: MBL fold metallo-hydrolase [Clostridia bacterium]|nr:MBL fold metallo-hydrolase [Clostridia bacterium]